MNRFDKKLHYWCDAYHASLKEKYPCMYEGHIWLVGFFNAIKHNVHFKHDKPHEQTLAALIALKYNIINTIEANLPKFNKHIQ